MIISEIRHSIILTELEKKTVLNAINETLSINRQVKNEAMRINTIFLEKFREVEWIRMPGYGQKVVEFSENVFELPFSVTFTFVCYNIFNPEQYEAADRKLGFGGAQLKGVKSISAVVGCLSGNVKTNALPSIQHELEHLFQQVKKEGGGLRVKGFGKDVGDQIYKTAVSVLHDKTATNDERDVAFIIYTHANHEIDAFANQLYQELENGKCNTDETLKKSKAFIYYKVGKNRLSAIRNNRDTYEPIINSYGLKFNNFISVYSGLNRRFINKIGKVLTCFNDEILSNSQVDFFDLNNI